ncbi:MAG: hypothetical protein M1834_004672 [Cirrosporium novae-zelandiae]|nr:MAG: hypothetical protein M1834_004672 [Cirrosporium novae-zelandiae]
MDTQTKPANAKEDTPMKGNMDNNEETVTEEEEVIYPGHFKFGLIFVALCLSIFEVTLDETIIATAVPTITNEFNSLKDVGWYGSAYLLTLCSFQLLFGKIYTIYSTKLTFLVALGILQVGSIICAAAPNSIALIFGRLIAGLGASGIWSGAITILSRSVPRTKIAPFNGLLGAVAGVSWISAPLVSGGIINNPNLSWRWIFWINPIVACPTLLVIGAFVSLPPPPAAPWKQKLAKVDLLGFSVFLPSIICLLLVLQWGGSEYGWTNARIIVLFILFGLLLAGFVAIQIWKQDGGVLPPRIVTQRSIAFGIFFSLCCSGASFILDYYLPIWFQAVKRSTALESSVDMLPHILSSIIMTTASGAVVPIIGYYVPMMIAATILLSIGIGLITTFTPYTNSPKWIGYQVLTGSGLGLALQQTVLAAQTILKLDDIPIGIAVMTLAQALGGTIFLSVSEAVFTSKLSSGLSAAIPGLDKSSILNAGATDLRTLIPAKYLKTVLRVYNDAVIQTWYVALALACLSILGVIGMEWVSVKPEQPTKESSRSESRSSECISEENEHTEKAKTDIEQ